MSIGLKLESTMPKYIIQHGINVIQMFCVYWEDILLTVHQSLQRLLYILHDYLRISDLLTDYDLI